MLWVPITGGTQGQVEWGPGQPDLMRSNQPMAWRLELDDLYGPFQPKPFYDSILHWLSWAGSSVSSTDTIGKIHTGNRYI